MSSVKVQAIEIIQDIPEDKLLPVIEMLKGFRLLYAQSENTIARDVTSLDAMGVFSQYKNTALIPMEKEAWGEAVKEKHVVT